MTTFPPNQAAVHDSRILIDLNEEFDPRILDVLELIIPTELTRDGCYFIKMEPSIVIASSCHVWTVADQRKINLLERKVMEKMVQALERENTFVASLMLGASEARLIAGMLWRPISGNSCATGRTEEEGVSLIWRESSPAILNLDLIPLSRAYLTPIWWKRSKELVKCSGKDWGATATRHTTCITTHLSQIQWSCIELSMNECFWREINPTQQLYQTVGLVRTRQQLASTIVIIMEQDEENVSEEEEQEDPQMESEEEEESDGGGGPPSVEFIPQTIVENFDDFYIEWEREQNKENISPSNEEFRKRPFKKRCNALDRNPTNNTIAE
ncbi:unnamed protein product [Cyprideis torosa]|uniref:Uncharacterized protein n=1 Tax=Cyprideis torosa TaxID=163714 RepID=A0A7R8ZPM4_9CRUS|nr:unnamed protein product [Cyprideis torosa]CAG0894332.1 unnamed protein product [Cyprideis torosa]